MATQPALPEVFGGELPELWFVADEVDVDRYPYLLTVDHFCSDRDQLSAQVALLNREPSWKVIGFHAGAEVAGKSIRKKSPSVSLVASRRPNPRTLYAKWLADFIRLGDSADLGPVLEPRDVREVRDLPPGLFDDDDPEARHMAVHLAMESSPGDTAGWSHLMCPATPIEVLMDIFRSDRARAGQWALFLEFSGPRDLKVDIAARLAAQDAKYQDPDYLEHIAHVLADD